MTAASGVINFCISRHGRSHVHTGIHPADPVGGMTSAVICILQQSMMSSGWYTVSKNVNLLTHLQTSVGREEAMSTPASTPVGPIGGMTSAVICILQQSTMNVTPYQKM